MDQHLPALSTESAAQIRGALYDSVGDLDAWPEALRGVGRAMGAAGVVVTLPTFDPGSDYAYDAVGVDIDFKSAADYALVSGSLDPWSERALVQHGPKPGMTLLGREMCPRDDLLRSHWFEPVIEPIGTGEVMSSTFRAPSLVPAALGVIVLHRPYAWEPYDHDGARRFSQFSAEIARASRTAFALRAARRNSVILASALDRLTQPVFVLGRDGFVLFANAAADDLLTDGSIVCLDHQRLSARSESARGDVARAIADAVNEKRGSDVPVARPGRLGCVLTFTPMPSDASDKMGVVSGLTMLVVHDPESRRGPDALMAKAVFGLTDAEASIAVDIAAGKTLAEVAGARGVSRETVRVQLRSIFAKTGVRRQAELGPLMSGLSRDLAASED